VAALLVSGQTIHRLMGFYNKQGDATDISVIDALAVQLRTNHMNFKKYAQLNNITHVQLDEISMLRPLFVDNVDRMFREVRRKPNVPFGGVSMIFFGDFLQIPPVDDNRDVNNPDTRTFAFESYVWNEAQVKCHLLDHSFRHDKDPEYKLILSDLRMGVVTPEGEALLKSCVRDPSPDLLVTHIYPTHRLVDAENARRLASLVGEEHVYKSIDTFHCEPRQQDAMRRILDNTPAPMTLILKQDAQVMFLRNMNVSTILAHGGTIPGIDPENVSPETAQTLLLGNGSIGKVVGFGSVGEGQPSMPIVHFPETGIRMPVYAHAWTIDDRPGGKPQAQRSQVPLKLCWSITSHKSQGQTITSAVVADLSSVFTFGQAYVILSRVKSRDQLYLKPFEMEKIKAHPTAVAFYEQLAKQKALETAFEADFEV
jgi:ATP-dependent DNA helicase PIF1